MEVKNHQLKEILKCWLSENFPDLNLIIPNFYDLVWVEKHRHHRGSSFSWSDRFTIIGIINESLGDHTSQFHKRGIYVKHIGLTGVDGWTLGSDVVAENPKFFTTLRRIITEEDERWK